jgi:hypothetical protein
MVAYYGNYVLIISKLTTFFATVLGSVGASVGNLVAENNRPRMMNVFWELMALRYFVAGVVCFSIYQLIVPFITLWLGAEYILNPLILDLLLINLFITISRGTVDNFNFAYGHYADVWSAWVEGIINVSVTLVCGYYWGIQGILLGKTASIVPIIIFWKPYYLFRDGFNLNYWLYWRKTIIYYILFIVSSLVIHFLLTYLPIDPYLSFGWWVVYAVVCCGAFVTIYTIAIICYAPGGKSLLHRLPLNKIGIQV